MAANGPPARRAPRGRVFVPGEALPGAGRGYRMTRRQAKPDYRRVEPGGKVVPGGLPRATWLTSRRRELRDEGQIDLAIVLLDLPYSIRMCNPVTAVCFPKLTSTAQAGTEPDSPSPSLDGATLELPASRSGLRAARFP